MPVRPKPGLHKVPIGATLQILPDGIAVVLSQIVPGPVEKIHRIKSDGRDKYNRQNHFQQAKRRAANG
jgi:hypothetical protein